MVAACRKRGRPRYVSWYHLCGLYEFIKLSGAVTVSLGALGVDRPLYEIKAELFKALGHPARIRILELLTPGELPVRDLLADTGMEASHLSQHLAVLKRAGVVAARREGNAVHYRTAHASVDSLLTAAREFLVDALKRTAHTLTALQDSADG